MDRVRETLDPVSRKDYLCLEDPGKQRQGWGQGWYPDSHCGRGQSESIHFTQGPSYQPLLPWSPFSEPQQEPGTQNTLFYLILEKGILF